MSAACSCGRQILLAAFTRSEAKVAGTNAKLIPGLHFFLRRNHECSYFMCGVAVSGFLAHSSGGVRPGFDVTNVVPVPARSDKGNGLFVNVFYANHGKGTHQVDGSQVRAPVYGGALFSRARGCADGKRPMLCRFQST